MNMGFPETACITMKMIELFSYAFQATGSLSVWKKASNFMEKQGF
jgi:hypothetical protein